MKDTRMHYPAGARIARSWEQSNRDVELAIMSHTKRVVNMTAKVLAQAVIDMTVEVESDLSDCKNELEEIARAYELRRDSAILVNCHNMARHMLTIIDAYTAYTSNH